MKYGNGDTENYKNNNSLDTYNNNNLNSDI